MPLRTVLNASLVDGKWEFRRRPAVDYAVFLIPIERDFRLNAGSVLCDAGRLIDTEIVQGIVGTFLAQADDQSDGRALFHCFP